LPHQIDRKRGRQNARRAKVRPQRAADEKVGRVWGATVEGRREGRGPKEWLEGHEEGVVQPKGESAKKNTQW